MDDGHEKELLSRIEAYRKAFKEMPPIGAALLTVLEDSSPPLANDWANWRDRYYGFIRKG